MTRCCFLVAFSCATAFCANGALAQVPAALAEPGETTLVTYHAEGAQIYECKADATGKLTWSFREPIATLLLNDKTVGRHYAGPTWELSDGSAITGKASGTAPGATAKDIPWLKLDVETHRGNGLLSDVSAVQRISTHGGEIQGPCDQAGSFRSVPYDADYSFLGKPDQNLTSSIPHTGQSH